MSLEDFPKLKDLCEREQGYVDTMNLYLKTLNEMSIDIEELPPERSKYKRTSWKITLKPNDVYRYEKGFYVEESIDIIPFIEGMYVSAHLLSHRRMVIDTIKDEFLSDRQS